MNFIMKATLLMLVTCTFVYSLNLIAPQNKEIKGGEILYLGEIGPGQTVELRLDPMVNVGGIYGDGGYYDTAIISSKPEGWSSTQSLLYANPMWVTLSANPNAAEGEYYANITVIDERYGEKLDNITFTIKVKIKWDILDVSVTPTSVTVGPNQPAVYKIQVTNKGAASDDYEISTVGTKKWDFRKPVFIPAHGTRTITYEVAASDEETYQPVIKVVSRSSQNIHKEQKVALTVKSDLKGDLKAINNGLLLFPVFEAPIYALGGLISNLLG